MKSKVPKNPMHQLYDRLRAVGLPTPFVRGVALPSWWDDEAAAYPTGYSEGLLLLSRHLGLEFASLQSADGPVRFRSFGECKFKKQAGTTVDQLQLCRILAQRAAQLAASTIQQEATPLPPAQEIRRSILAGGAPWVGLPQLLDYCWTAGVPVLHLNHFPRKARRPAGFAAVVHGRPTVVLCKNQSQPAWLLFILAHELGHLALGHVPPEGALLDERVEGGGEDEEECAADAFALELLTGRPDTRLFQGGRFKSAAALAEAARGWGERMQIDPGHAVLNYAHGAGPTYLAVGNAALKLLDPDADAVGLVAEASAAHLDLSALPEDSSEFLMRATKREPAE